MSGQPFENQALVRDLVSAYLKDHGMTSLRKVAAYVEQEAGFRPSPATIGRLVRQNGYSRPKTAWEKKK